MITEKEWNEQGIGLLGKYDLFELMDYVAFIEHPKHNKEAADRIARYKKALKEKEKNGR